MIDLNTCDPMIIVVARGSRAEEYSGYFSQDNVDVNPPEGYNRYAIRHSDDDDSVFATLEEHVMVNRAGYFFTQEKIDIPSGNDDDGFDLGYLEIIDWSFD